jgi:hypothetical protein
MPGAIITIDQDRDIGFSAGTAGIARKDLWLSRTIRPHCDTGGVSTFAWALLDKPPGSSASITGPTTNTPSFTPDLLGSYRLQLITDGGGVGNEQILICAVLRDTNGTIVGRGWRSPAVGETSAENNFSSQTRGWAPDFEFILADLEASIPFDGILVQDEGSVVATRKKLNFIGAGVTAVDNVGQTRVDITIPGGYTSVEDEGTPLTARTAINFTGAGVTASDSGGKTVVNIPGGGGGTTSPVIFTLATGFTTTFGTFSRAGSLYLDMTPFPPTNGGLNRHVQFEAEVQKSSGATSVEVRLLDITHGVAVTGTGLTYSATNNLSRVTSGDLTVGSSSGNIRSDAATIYEVQFKMNGGTPSDQVWGMGARLVISYS